MNYVITAYTILSHHIPLKVLIYMYVCMCIYIYIYIYIYIVLKMLFLRQDLLRMKIILS